jgi:NADPH:quinone reductase-like Zn-dependent oxidoreductase
MKKIIFHHAGKPADILNVEQVDMPQYGPDDVLIKVIASPINPSDIMFVQNLYGIRPQFPSPAGFEGVGTIVEKGENVRIPVGTRVSFTGIGAWGEYTVTNHRTLMPVPDAMPDDVAAQLFVNPFTAVSMVEDSGVKEGEWLMITACGSALGKMVIQLCKMKGIKTIGTVRRDDINDEIRAMGVTEIVNTSQPDWSKQVQELTHYKGVRAVLECVGGATTEESVKCLGRGGLMLIYGLLGLEDPAINIGLMIFKELTIKGFWLTEWMKNAPAEVRNKLAVEVITLLTSGQIQLPVEAIYGLDDIAAAVTHADAPGRFGKILIKP